MSGQEMREIRRELGWTQKRLAVHLGFSSSYLAQLERGIRLITKRTGQAVHVLYLVYRLARTMGLIETPSHLRP